MMVTRAIRNFLTVKNLSLLIIVVVLAVGAFVAVKSYEASAPRRVLASFISAISKDGDMAKAYGLTNASYQKNVPFAQFSTDFKPLYKSKVPYTIIGSRLVSGVAVSGGVLEDLNGANYNYLMGISHTNGKWLINSVTIVKQ